MESNRLLTNFSVLLAIILIEGFVTISVEILTLRQLTPFVGNSVIVTSLIIGVFLLFLAIGYWRGGKYDSGFERVLKRNFTRASICLGLGLSYLFLNLFFYYFEVKYLLNSLVVLGIYLLLITAPAVYWLGQTVPITTNLFRQNASIGSISGNVLFLSTLGSFLGAILTSLLLFNFLGVAWTVIINFLALFFLIILLSHRDWNDLFHLTIVSIVGVFIFYLNVGMEQSYLLKTNNYANYRLEPEFKMDDGRKGKAFVVNDSLSSFLDADKKGSSYIELIKRFLFKELKLKGKDILVIGAGGFSLSAESDYQNRFTYLDIDSQIAGLAEKHFIGKVNGSFISEDARNYVKHSKNRYDVIVNDAYSNKNAIPAHLLTREYFQQMRRLLKPNGIVVINLIISPMLNDVFSQRVNHTISTEFPDCMKVPLQYYPRLTNVVYFCNTTDSKPDNLTYTDNLNPVTLDYFTSMQKAYEIAHQQLNDK